MCFFEDGKESQGDTHSGTKPVRAFRPLKMPSVLVMNLIGGRYAGCFRKDGNGGAQLWDSLESTHLAGYNFRKDSNVVTGLRKEGGATVGILPETTA